LFAASRGGEGESNGHGEGEDMVGRTADRTVDKTSDKTPEKAADKTADKEGVLVVERGLPVLNRGSGSGKREVSIQSMATVQWGYSCDTVLLQCCYSGVTVVLQWCHSGVT
jgi:hypothetical protein